jgi:hypothetical protein
MFIRAKIMRYVFTYFFSIILTSLGLFSTPAQAHITGVLDDFRIISSYCPDLEQGVNDSLEGCYGPLRRIFKELGYQVTEELGEKPYFDTELAQAVKSFRVEAGIDYPEAWEVVIGHYEDTPEGWQRTNKNRVIVDQETKNMISIYLNSGLKCGDSAWMTATGKAAFCSEAPAKWDITEEHGYKDDVELTDYCKKELKAESNAVSPVFPEDPNFSFADFVSSALTGLKEKALKKTFKVPGKIEKEYLKQLEKQKGKGAEVALEYAIDKVLTKNAATLTLWLVKEVLDATYLESGHLCYIPDAQMSIRLSPDDICNYQLHYYSADDVEAVLWDPAKGRSVIGIATGKGVELFTSSESPFTMDKGEEQKKERGPYTWQCHVRKDAKFKEGMAGVDKEGMAGVELGDLDLTGFCDAKFKHYNQSFFDQISYLYDDTKNKHVCGLPYGAYLDGKRGLFHDGITDKEDQQLVLSNENGNYTYTIDLNEACKWQYGNTSVQSAKQITAKLKGSDRAKGWVCEIK